MKIFSKDGIEMMEVKSIDLDGEKLVLRGKMMGTMATVIYIHPKDMWAAFKLFSWSVKFKMPFLLFKGWRASAQPKTAKS